MANSFNIKVESMRLAVARVRTAGQPGRPTRSRQIIDKVRIPPPEPFTAEHVQPTKERLSLNPRYASRLAGRKAE